jgi:hypothetical protein
MDIQKIVEAVAIFTINEKLEALVEKNEALLGIKLASLNEDEMKSYFNMTEGR